MEKEGTGLDSLHSVRNLLKCTILAISVKSIEFTSSLNCKTRIFPILKLYQIWYMRFLVLFGDSGSYGSGTMK